MNQSQSTIVETEICIIGAGPAGAAAALKLDRLGIPSLLLDKAVFPREKICGDGLTGKTIYALNRIDKQLAIDFHERRDIGLDAWGVKMVFPNKKEINIIDRYNQSATAKPEFYVSKRIEFDNFLIDRVKTSELIDFRENINIQKFEKTPEGWILKDKNDTVIAKTQLLLDASGALSRFTKDIVGIKKENRHYGGAIRAYYKNVTGFTKENLLEVYFEDELLPGYIWIFPLPDGHANVGVYSRSDFISKNKLNLKELLNKVLSSNPQFAERFKNAEIIGKVAGYPLPIGSKKRPISGDGYLLLGDAAYLIDPITGEGIGNAILSGKIAGEIVQEARRAKRFDASFLKRYDKAVYKKTWTEFQINSFIQYLISSPWRTDKLSSILVGGKKFFSSILSRITNYELS